jgi:hypothetical protein
MTAGDVNWMTIQNNTSTALNIIRYSIIFIMLVGWYQTYLSAKSKEVRELLSLMQNKKISFTKGESFEFTNII